MVYYYFLTWLAVWWLFWEVILGDSNWPCQPCLLSFLPNFNHDCSIAMTPPNEKWSIVHCRIEYFWVWISYLKSTSLQMIFFKSTSNQIEVGFCTIEKKLFTFLEFHQMQNCKIEVAKLSKKLENENLTFLQICDFKFFVKGVCTNHVDRILGNFDPPPPQTYVDVFTK